MAPEGMPSPLIRVLLGLLCLAGGAVPMLAAFDLGPLDSSAINGPPWLGFLAGAVFVAGGSRSSSASGCGTACCRTA